jgi:hypothetical protein
MRRGERALVAATPESPRTVVLLSVGQVGQVGEVGEVGQEVKTFRAKAVPVKVEVKIKIRAKSSPVPSSTPVQSPPEFW